VVSYRWSVVIGSVSAGGENDAASRSGEAASRCCARDGAAIPVLARRLSGGAGVE
jgi:hypothetical protein